MSITGLRYAETAVGSFSSGTGWDATTPGPPANAVGKNITDYARWSSTTISANGTLELTWPAQALLPGSGVMITAVRAYIRYATNSATSLSTLTGRFFNGTTALGTGTTAIAATANVIADATITLSNPTYAQLADLRLRIVGTRPVNTGSSILYVYRVSIEIDYSWDAWTTTTGEYGVYRVSPPALPSAVGANADYVLGTQFEVLSATKFFRGVRLYRPPDGLMTSEGMSACLYDKATATMVAGTLIYFNEVVNDPIGGWIERRIPSPVAITPGNQYIVAAHFPVNTPIVTYAWPSGGRDDGPVRASGGSNSCYRGVAGGALVFPDAAVGVEQCYPIDPIIGDALPFRELSRFHNAA